MTQTDSFAYDPDAYDDIPSYEWNEDFDVDDFAETIEVSSCRCAAPVMVNSGSCTLSSSACSGFISRQCLVTQLFSI